jgi:hypothetical protein
MLVSIQRNVFRAAVQRLALARQKYWEIRTDFTTLLLHNYKSKLDCEDYRKNQLASLACLAFL